MCAQDEACSPTPPTGGPRMRRCCSELCPGWEREGRFSGSQGSCRNRQRHGAPIRLSPAIRAATESRSEADRAAPRMERRGRLRCRGAFSMLPGAPSSPRRRAAAGVVRVLERHRRRPNNMSWPTALAVAPNSTTDGNPTSQGGPLFSAHSSEQPGQLQLLPNLPPTTTWSSSTTSRRPTTRSAPGRADRPRPRPRRPGQAGGRDAL